MSRKTPSLVEVLEAVNALCWLGIGSKQTQALAAICTNVVRHSMLLNSSSHSIIDCSDVKMLQSCQSQKPFLHK